MYGPAGSCRRCVWPPMVNVSLTAVAMLLSAKPTSTGPAWMPSPSLIEAVALNSPATPALVSRKRPLPCVDRDADVARAEEQRDVGGGDADDRRVVGGAEDLVGAGADARARRRTCRRAAGRRSRSGPCADVPTSTRRLRRRDLQREGDRRELDDVASRPVSATVAANSPVRPGRARRRSSRRPVWVTVSWTPGRVAERERDVSSESPA